MTKLIVISAPSGAGKTTLCARLLQDFQELELSISTTTRSPRHNEKHGREYFFVAEDQFKNEIARQRFAEWALVHGNYYGTSKDVIERAFASGKSVLLDIDVQGAASLKKTYPNDYFGVFITPPSLDVLEARLRARGTDSEETIQRRLKNSLEELKRSSEFDEILVNDILDETYRRLKEAVQVQLRPGGAFHG
jgi:guanylate kinase